MVTEPITIREAAGIRDVSGEVYVSVGVTSDRNVAVAEVEVEVDLQPTMPRDYLTAEDDPVLAKLWDNDDDAIFDTM